MPTPGSISNREIMNRDKNVFRRLYLSELVYPEANEILLQIEKANSLSTTNPFNRAPEACVSFLNQEFNKSNKMIWDPKTKDDNTDKENPSSKEIIDLDYTVFPLNSVNFKDSFSFQSVSAKETLLLEESVNLEVRPQNLKTSYILLN
jgi:hypothetical protein